MNKKYSLTRIFVLILALSLLLLAAACSSGDEPLLEDAFDDSDSGWGSDSREAFDRGYRNEEYYIQVYEPDWFVWARPGERYDDVIVEVEARQFSGAAPSHYGLLCRFDSPDNFYYFSVTGDGFYAILRVEDGEAEVLTGEGFQPSPILRSGEVTQRIRAVCQEEELVLYVNGERVAVATDDAFRRGDVGVGVGTDGDNPIEVRFDNLVVRAPQEE